ncbi:hypothetical protein RvY_00234 [Ramazzottius varieornatus]|uniref:Sphingomyelin synthase-like domain-containing protein n=1 Tax=Ramazzottius varieornatus TaxID=947166 RepID=A0A1D1UC19_RAMVA|nr:hypothetical protein RvY_00234 [Ramazzottius varieornatus]
MGRIQLPPEDYSHDNPLPLSTASDLGIEVSRSSCLSSEGLSPDYTENYDGVSNHHFEPRHRRYSSSDLSALSSRSEPCCKINLLPLSADAATLEEGLVKKVYPKEYGKTFQAFLFLLGGLLSSSLALAVVHDLQPMSLPLPDIVFRYVPQFDQGLELSEYIIVFITYPTLIALLLHQHRSIIFRRVFLLTGILYFCRGITIFVTVLPQANLKYPCASRENSTSALMIVHRAVSLLSGLGMSINGRLVYCGDFIYSGHTCSLVLCCLVFNEYTPQNKQIFRIAKRSLYLLATVGVLMISFSRTHYTVDIVIAYVITTMLFRIYHTIAAHAHLKEHGENNYLSHAWWFRFVRHFEINVPEGKLPMRYNFPFECPTVIAQKWRAFRNR